MKPSDGRGGPKQLPVASKAASAGDGRKGPPNVNAAPAKRSGPLYTDEARMPQRGRKT